MTEIKVGASAVELIPRRVFVTGVGAVGALFIVPGCGGTPAKDPSSEAGPAPSALDSAPTTAEAAVVPAPTISANEAWEAEAKSLEGLGQGLYSAKDPKDFPGKEGSHVPKVALTEGKVALTTTHPTEAVSAKKPKGHFISDHYLRDSATGYVFAWKKFDLKPGETAASEFELPKGVTSFTAYQVCNLHWTWDTEPQASV